jgi:hypothetical protein
MFTHYITPVPIRSAWLFPFAVADNYPDIGSKGIPEDVFHGLSDEFSKKLPYKMAYWVRPKVATVSAVRA